MCVINPWFSEVIHADWNLAFVYKSLLESVYNRKHLQLVFPLIIGVKFLLSFHYHD